MKPEDIGAYYESILEQEVRKEGGIYYSSPFIVDYIVKRTVGEILKDKTAEEAAKITIVDPSCGAGVFLLGAYQYLLDWHKKHFGMLTLKQRQQILINNIFGVDIDENAVEITKLSLLLKCLEDETTASIENTRRLFQEKALPNIDVNIRSGNSLIGNDFYSLSNTQFTAKEQMQINAFDWELEFPAIFKSGGFDIVIGNPPWEVVIGKEYKKNITHLTVLNNYYKKNYPEIQGETNLYRLFIERIIKKLLVANGHWGYIMPSSLLNDKSASGLRQLFLKSFPFIEVNHFPEKARVFKHVTQDVCIYLFSNVRSQIRIRTGLLTADDYNKKFVILPKSLLLHLDKIPLVKSKPDKMKAEDIGTYYESILEQEVRKEDGIYYSPSFIVDYIVKHTVGKLLKDKTAEEAAKITIVDPSCGAGVFLLGAYQYLLDWHKKRFGTLTLKQRKQILINNIFGVDIDENAVEITKYCLLSQCFQGKSITLDLDENIRCGNSLIDTNFHEECSDDKISMRIKPFNWKRAFPQVFKQGGFNVVIGNPPYVDYRLLDTNSLQYFKRHYQSTKVSSL